MQLSANVFCPPQPHIYRNIPQYPVTSQIYTSRKLQKSAKGQLRSSNTHTHKQGTATTCNNSQHTCAAGFVHVHLIKSCASSCHCEWSWLQKVCNIFSATGHQRKLGSNTSELRMTFTWWNWLWWRVVREWDLMELTMMKGGARVRLDLDEGWCEPLHYMTIQ